MDELAKLFYNVYCEDCRSAVWNWDESASWVEACNKGLVPTYDEQEGLDCPCKCERNFSVA